MTPAGRVNTNPASSRKADLHGDPVPPLRLVTFGLDGERYALPLAVVERVLPIVEVSVLPRAPSITLGVINYHGTIIPVVDVRRRLGFAPRDYGVTAHLLIARTSRRLLALPVDQVFGVSAVAQDTVTPPNMVLRGIGHVAGIATLPDGVLLIQDLETFLSLDEEQQLADALHAGES
jgi:purine-binding chemotaxis protein CheW